MINLEIGFDSDKYRDMIARCVLYGKNVNLAIARAAKEAAQAGKTEAKRQLAAETTLPSSKIGKTIEAKTLKEGGEMRIFSSVQDILEFKGVEKTGVEGVIVEINKGKGKRNPKAFVGKMGKNQKHDALYKRDENGIVRYHGPTTVGLFKANETVHNAAIEKIMETFEKRIVHQLDFILSDSSSRANLNG
jgi:hypothetical protein